MNRIARLCRSGCAVSLAALLGVPLLSGCKVLTIQEDAALRARRAANFDAAHYVDEIWAKKAVPTIERRAVPADKLVRAIDTGLDRAGDDYGRRVGEGSAWTFVISGTGVVTAIDTTSRRGSADVALSGGAAGRVVRLQIGPIVSGTAIRDALPFVSFNDFADQLAFADVGRALTKRSLDNLRPVLGRLRPGALIRFTGVANVRAPGEPLTVTPVAISAGGVS